MKMFKHFGLVTPNIVEQVHHGRYKESRRINWHATSARLFHLNAPPPGTGHADDVVSGRGDKPENTRDVHVHVVTLSTTIIFCEGTCARALSEVTSSKKTDVWHLTE